jgi:hypothetical protein
MFCLLVMQITGRAWTVGFNAMYQETGLIGHTFRLGPPVVQRLHKNRMERDWLARRVTHRASKDCRHYVADLGLVAGLVGLPFFLLIPPSHFSASMALTDDSVASTPSCSWPTACRLCTASHTGDFGCASKPTHDRNTNTTPIQISCSHLFRRTARDLPSPT